jgi:hypothetical protein
MALISWSNCRLHPEEFDWVTKRNVKTSDSLAKFVTDQLGANALPQDRARISLKVAIANSGGGKRAFFNSLGACTGVSMLQPRAQCA